MPIYEYKCDTCGEHFEKLQRFGERPVSTCPHGHNEVHRVLTAPAIIFNAPGFYTTDNRGKKEPTSEGAKCATCS